MVEGGGVLSRILLFIWFEDVPQAGKAVFWAFEGDVSHASKPTYEDIIEELDDVGLGWLTKLDVVCAEISVTTARCRLQIFNYSRAVQSLPGQSQIRFWFV